MSDPLGHQIRDAFRKLEEIYLGPEESRPMFTRDAVLAPYGDWDVPQTCNISARLDTTIIFGNGGDFNTQQRFLRMMEHHLRSLEQNLRNVGFPDIKVEILYKKPQTGLFPAGFSAERAAGDSDAPGFPKLDIQIPATPQTLVCLKNALSLAAESKATYIFSEALQAAKEVTATLGPAGEAVLRCAAKKANIALGKSEIPTP